MLVVAPSGFLYSLKQINPMNSLRKAARSQGRDLFVRALGLLGRERFTRIMDILIDSRIRRIQQASFSVPDSALERVRFFKDIVDSREDGAFAFPYLRLHLRDVAKYSLLICLALRDQDVYTPHLSIALVAGFLHDIGKTVIPRRLFDMEFPFRVFGFELDGRDLTDFERNFIRTEHVRTGITLVSLFERDPSFAEMVVGVANHHERWDGKLDGRYPGYPKGLKGEEIPLLGRIVQGADILSILLRPRSYSKQGMDDPSSEFEREAGKQFDPQVAQCVIKILAERRRFLDRAQEKMEGSQFYHLLELNQIGLSPVTLPMSTNI